VHLSHGHSAEQFVARPHPGDGRAPAIKWLTLTWNQGSEMARYDLVTGLFEQGVFAVNSGSRWMRGTKENKNGLLRQYLLRGTDLRVDHSNDLASSRPRSTTAHERHWAFPTELYAMAS